MDMLKKINRLGGKQINRLMGRGRKLYGKHFVCVAYPQRHFLPYTQWGVTIPVKLDKRATMRNALKRRSRIVFAALVATYPLGTNQQLFFFLNKKTLDELKQLIATTDKTTIFAYRKEACLKDFTYFLRHLCSPISSHGTKR